MTTVADFAREPSRAARWRDRWADAIIVNGVLTLLGLTLFLVAPAVACSREHR